MTDKWQRTKVFVAAAGIALLGACRDEEADPVHTPDPATSRTIGQGEVIGFTTGNGGPAWLGVPYAAPPVGDLRWRAPRSPAAWTGVMEAVVQPDWCPQITNQLDEFYGISQGELRGNEDCLYLNIYAPSGTPPPEGWPVMVWLHGGANIWGRAEQYDGSTLAEEQGLVVVIPQYRIGPLGALSTPALRESPQDPHDLSPNFGLLDAVAALEWVEDNIGTFGGDTARVTLFGESSGAIATLGLHVSPLTPALFQGAIAQSGVPISISVDGAENGGSGTKNPSSQIIDSWFPENPAPDGDELRTLSLETIFEAYRPNDEVNFNVPSMIEDGIVIPEAGVFATLASPNGFGNRPLMIGSNRDEAKLFFGFDEEFTGSLAGIPFIRDRQFYDTFTSALSRTWRVTGVVEPTEQLIDDAFHGLYTYQFDWDEEGYYLVVDVSRLLGATHIIEVPFVFGTFDNFFGDASNMIYHARNEARRLELSAQMMSYWAQFAYAGAPGRGRNGNLPEWQPATNTLGPETMTLDTSRDGGLRMSADDDSLEDVMSDLSGSGAVNAEEKCRTAMEMNQVFGLAAPELAAFAQQLCSNT